MAWNDSAQLRIVCRHKTCDLSELGRITGESQDRQIGLIERSVEWEISDERGMSVVEDGEPVFECNEERCCGAAVRARRKRVVMGARTDFEFNAFQDELIADAGPPELLLFQSVPDKPASQGTGSEDCCAG